MRLQERAILEDQPAWRIKAECRGVDPHRFFPERGEPVRFAKAMCRVCPVRDECLQYALDNSIEYGVWGGTTHRQRQRLRSAQRARAAA